MIDKIGIGEIHEELRDYQEAALKALRAIDKKEKFSTIINLPTGAGKTKIIIDFCKEQLDKGNYVLFLADRIALLGQTVKKFSIQAWDNAYKFQLICGGSSNSEIKKYKLSDTDAEVPILFASVGTIRTIAEKEVKEFSAWLNKSQENGRRLYIVYDETQHIGTNGAGGIMSALFGCQDSYVKGVEKTYSLSKIGLVGLTATVYRGDKFIESFNAWYKDGYDFDNNKVLHIDSDYGDYTLSDISQIRNNRIAPVDIEQLLDEGFLANPDIIKVSDYKWGMPDTEEKEMEYLADRISKNYSELGKTAVIVRNSNMAKLLCDELEKKNIKSFNFTVKGLKPSNDGEPLDRDRAMILEQFSKKDNKAILIAISIFDEGIDVPDLNTLYLYAPTNSHVVLRQRVGRVLRGTAEGNDEDKRVIWQYYPMECQKLSEEQFAELLNGNISLLPETEEELRKDKFEWEKSNGKLAIPPIIYKEPLPKEELSFVVLPTDKKAFEMIYGTDALEEGDGIGYFYNSLSLFDEKIYVRKVEKDSYMQFLRVLQNDWISIQAMRQGTCSFTNYAGLLGVSEQVLISDIKKICFSLSVKDAFRKNGTVKNTVVACEDDIRKFFDWFISGEIHYRELVFADNNSSTASDALDKLLDECYKEDAKQKEFIILDHAPTDEDKRQLKEILSKIQKNGKSAKSEIAKKVSSSEWSNRAKTYTEILSYGVNREYLYRDVVRMRYILKAGIIDGNRIKMGEEDIAFTGIDDSGNQIVVNHLSRHTLSRITKDDWLLTASALVEIPNHVFITQDDVDEYEKSVVVPVGVEDKDRLVTEYLMALGYADNDEILRYQCKTFKPTPKLLQYMVYEKIYKKLAEEVCFYDVNGDLCADCQNKVQLQNEQTQMLNSFGISLPTELNPLDDVTYDYRPYLKAVPYYQGVKAEFLCRMLNDAIQLMDIDEPEYIVDGFGGSGAISMNSFYKGIHSKHVYNDLGTMNTSFYRVIQTDRIKLEQRIEEIIDDAFSFGVNNCTDSLLKKFEKLAKYRVREAEKEIEKLGKIKDKKAEESKKVEGEKEKEAEDIDKKIAEAESVIYSLKRIIDEPKTEKKYIEDFNKRVQNFRESEKYKSEKKSLRAIWLQNRLMHFNAKNAKVLGMDCDDTFQALVRSVEEYFHSFMLICYYFYQMLTSEINIDEVKKSGVDEIDLALVFFFYNSISHRHFYNDCTFEKIMELIQNYKDWLVIAESIAKNMRVEQEDALVLLNDDTKEEKDFNHIPREIIYNTPKTLWYLDIPYTSTDSSDYVPDWFKVETFQNALSDNKGIYVVSSRCNVCLSDDEKAVKPLNVEPNDLVMPEKEENDLDSKDISEDEISGSIKKHTKEFQIFDFLNGFTTSEYADKYEKYIKNMEVQNLSDDLPEIGKVHLENGREAQYILISFTKVQEEFVSRLSDSEEKDGTPIYSIDKSIVKNNVKIDENYIRRMLASTHYSKVPVEIMITNAEIKFEESPIIKVSEDIGVLPTFRTGVDSSQYMAEPAIVYMKYEKFMDIMIQLLYKDAWEQYKADESASGWSEYFSSLFNK